MLSLNIFGFRALWSPYFFIFLLLVLLGYFLLTIKYRNYFEHSTPLTKSQGASFTIAIVILYAIKGSPLDLMGHIMFYAHMIQMGVLYLLVPIFMIIGIPEWIWRSVINHNKIRPLFSFFTKPLFALLLFTVVFSIYHIPLVFDVVKSNMWSHSIYTIVLYILATFMWWPIMTPLKEEQSLTGLKQIGYIFASGILLTPACALIIFADTPIYATYSDPTAWMEAMKLCVPSTTLSSLNLSGPEMFNSMSLLNDQQLGGVIMKVIQEIIYGFVLAHIFFNWYKNEQAETKAEEQQLLNPHPIK